jgi:hypothetical protein
MLLLLLPACVEKKSDVATAPPIPQNSNKLDPTEEPEEPVDPGDPTTSYDVCKDGLEKADLGSSLSSLVSTLCEDGKLTEMRKAENVYKGGSETKVKKEYKKQESETTSLKVYTSALIDTKPEYYYKFVRLQFSKPQKIRGDDEDCEEADPFVCDPGITVSNTAAESGSNVITYSYENVGDGEGGRIFYSAKSTFKTLKSGTAYVISTIMTDDEEPETITKLLGLIIIVKKGTKTEVITISDQSYTHSAEEKSAFNSKLSNGLDAEQIRSFKNGTKAQEAVDML